MNLCITVVADSGGVPHGAHSHVEQVQLHVPTPTPPHPHKTERRVYLPQAEAAVTRRIKYHFTLSSVSHNRVKKWKKGRRKEGCLCRSSHWPLLLHSLCVSEKMVHWLLTIKKKHRGEEKKIQFSSGDALFHSCYMKGIAKRL